ncbi:AI-2E family transporter [Candidatus Poribacteria bacterium]|nr:AI-2E family transporter [Candidatus Poribacteria bacterium]
MNRPNFKDAPHINTCITIFVFVISYAWIGLAFAMGTESQRMIVHPSIPIILIFLLAGFRGDDSINRVTNVAIVLISIWTLARLQTVFIPFIVGFSLAYVVNVAISGLQKLPIPLPKGKTLFLPKIAAVAIIIVLIIGIILLFAFIIIPQLIDQAAGMRKGIVNFYNKVKLGTEKLIQDWEEKGEYPFKNRLPESWQDVVEDNIEKLGVYIQERIPNLARNASEILTNIFGGLSSGLLGTVGQISNIFFTFIVFIYAVGPFKQHIQKLQNIVSEEHRENIARYINEIDVNMRGFLKGQTTVIFTLAVLSAIAYSIIRVPFALMVGIIAGLSNAIPSVGPIIGGFIAVLACLTGFFTGTIGINYLLIQIVLVISAAIGIQLLDNSLISPRILSAAVEVHPLVVVFAMLLAVSLIGIWGAILAIPGVVIFRAIVKVSGEISAERDVRKAGLELES